MPIRGRTFASSAGRGKLARRQSRWPPQRWTLTGNRQSTRSTGRSSALPWVVRMPRTKYRPWPTEYARQGRLLSSDVGSRNGGLLDADDLEPGVSLAKRRAASSATPSAPPSRNRRYPLLAASALNSKIRSEPATRSGSGDPCHRDAQTNGAPSATMNPALSLRARRSGFSSVSIA